MSHAGDGAPVSATDSTEVAVGSADETRTSGAAVAAATARLAPGARIGRYEVRAQLGAGGMGVVYRAHDPELGRELAIKVVRGGQGERLLDEARTMAKLRHPNVVPVFDVATSEHGIYVVMPLYEGGTLHDWLHAAPRPWRAVLDRFVAAGRGLAAAHAAGLVHRDFKPRNVFLDASGVPLVGDFGLAAATESAETRGASATIAGTPAYMAPEQAAGTALDARADQYAYCISLWEGLTGVRPTDAETRTQGALAALPLPRGGDRRVPRWLLAAVSRGFAAMPERRWPSMEALLRHLERRRGRRTRMLLGASGVALAGAIAVGMLWARPSASEPCPDPVATLAPAWGDAARTQLISAVLATGLPFAQGTLDRVVPELDRYAADWRTRHQAYCKAARVDRTESAALLDARMACLTRGLSALGALTSTLRSDAVATLERAVDAVDRLPALADCEDREALTAYPLPASTEIRARIEAIDAELETFDARRELGLQPQQQAQELARVVGEARAVDWPPILARALLRYALALDAAAASDEAPAREAVEVAAQAQDDRSAGSAWLLVLGVLERRNKFAEARSVEAAARAAIVRAGNDRHQVFTFELRRIYRAMRSDQLVDAETAARELVAAAASPAEQLSAKAALAAVLGSRGHADQAVPLLREAVLLAEQVYGAEHPTVDTHQISLARNLALIGANEEARSILERAVERLERAKGPKHVVVASALRTLGATARAQGDLATARGYLERAVAALEHSEDRIERGLATGALAAVVQRLDGLAASVPVYEQALAHIAAAAGTEHQSYLSIEANLAVVFVNLENCARAIPAFEHVRTGFTKLGLTVAAMMTEVPLGACKIAAGAAREAIAPLESVRARCLAAACPPGVLASASSTLGRALVESRVDRRRGVDLLREAVAVAKRERRPADVAEFEGWLRRLSKK